MNDDAFRYRRDPSGQWHERHDGAWVPVVDNETAAWLEAANTQLAQWWAGCTLIAQDVTHEDPNREDTMGYKRMRREWKARDTVGRWLKWLRWRTKAR